MMTKDDVDRLDEVRELVREAIAELETADDKTLGWEPMVLLRAIERYVEKIMLAEKKLNRLAPVVEFPAQGWRKPSSLPEAGAIPSLARSSPEFRVLESEAWR